MAIFGGIKKPSMFGQVPGMGMMQPTMLPQPEMQMGMGMQQPMMAPEKPKFFGEGGVGRAIAGNIGDFLLQNAGMNPLYQPQQQHERAMQQRTQMAEQQQRQQRDNFLFEQNYKRDNPAAQQPTAMERNLEVYSRWTPEQRKLYGEMNPIVQTLGDGSARAVNRYAPQGAPANSNDDAPTIEDGYKYTPGPGGRSNSANWQPTGGSVGNGTGGFR